MSYVTRRAPSAMLRFVKCIEKKTNKTKQKSRPKFCYFSNKFTWVVCRRHMMRWQRANRRKAFASMLTQLGSHCCNILDWEKCRDWVGFLRQFSLLPPHTSLDTLQRKEGVGVGWKRYLSRIFYSISIFFSLSLHSGRKAKKKNKKNKKISWAAWILNARRPSDGFLFVCYNIKFIFSPPYVYYLIRCFQLVLTFYFWWVGCQAKDSLTCEWFIDENVWNKQTDGGGDFMLLWMDGFKK